MDTATFRQLRGLLVHYREDLGLPAWQRRSDRPGRALVGGFDMGRGTPGRCRWCRLPTDGRKKWHPACVQGYTIAIGRTIGLGNKPIITDAPCPCGADSRELDHIVSLALAKARGDRRGLLRAYTVGNLQWLCRECHKAKTADDFRRIANLKAGRPEDWTPPERVPPAPPAGARLL